MFIWGFGAKALHGVHYLSFCVKRAGIFHYCSIANVLLPLTSAIVMEWS